ncbi:hypothetical protein CPB83DRAFT_900390 [Crepidotus variabilis]|uniref:Uncharacterized protein n=1 Tax=Crepidotus variabilis TaxID=179855 RepID=A0A9P6JHY8_9AGAR|nr:hypothetical protein CPB83DRAFT_900390 [Crepidotus variabilis]
MSCMPNNHPPTPSLGQIGSTFIAAVCSLPAGTVDMSHLLSPFIQAETELRKIFVQEPLNETLTDLHLGLLDFFSSPKQLRETRSRVSGASSMISDEEFFNLYPTSYSSVEFLAAKHIFCLPPSGRRQTGVPSSVNSLLAFKERWDIFTHSILQNLRWENVIAAGGAVQACLQPIPLDGLSEIYHESPLYQKSDIDLFLWGLNESEAKEKILQIYEDVRSSTSWDLVCVRKRHVVSIHARFPFRTIQIVLRLYRSPAEILAGFDIDCACVAYNGDKILINPRAVVSMLTQCNTVDITRRSPTYKMRLRKYADRGFEVFVPSLDRSKVNPKILETNSGLLLRGLARLLVLEDMRNSCRKLDQFHLLNAPEASISGQNRQEAAKILDVHDYDPSIFSIPYGPTWNARRIKLFCANLEKRLGLHGMAIFSLEKSSKLYDHHCEAQIREVKKKQLNGNLQSEIDWDGEPQFHQHALVCSDSMENCLADACHFKPCLHPQQIEDSGKTGFLFPGPIQFITANPGGQLLSGSFKPTLDVEWTKDAYED